MSSGASLNVKVIEPRAKRLKQHNTEKSTLSVSHCGGLGPHLLLFAVSQYPDVFQCDDRCDAVNLTG